MSKKVRFNLENNQIYYITKNQKSYQNYGLKNYIFTQRTLDDMERENKYLSEIIEILKQKNNHLRKQIQIMKMENKIHGLDYPNKTKYHDTQFEELNTINKLLQS